MTNAKWYSPQLSRAVVRRLYHKAKFERTSMTHVANRLMETALDAEQSNECRRDTVSDGAASDAHIAGAVKPPAIASH
jgi:hypothetical protein